VLKATTELRPLTPLDMPELHELLDRHPLINLFVRNRVDSTRLQARWLGGQVWGYFEDGVLVSACHAGANVVPVEATPRALELFAEQIMADNVRPSSIVGPRDYVLPMWRLMEPRWGPARSPRLDQPFMVLDRDSRVRPDERVRPVLIDEFDTIYPACVAMFTEEVGVDPEASSRNGYRARVAQLISQGGDTPGVPAAGRLRAPGPARPGHRGAGASPGRPPGPADDRSGRHALRQRPQHRGSPGVRAGRLPAHRDVRVHPALTGRRR
jgi:hypothetical protein